jgi:hypothetical protein
MSILKQAEVYTQSVECFLLSMAKAGKKYVT